MRIIVSICMIPFAAIGAIASIVCNGFLAGFVATTGWIRHEATQEKSGEHTAR